MKLQIYSLNVSCDHEPRKALGHLVAQSFSLLRRVRALGPCALSLVHLLTGGGAVNYR